MAFELGDVEDGASGILLVGVRILIYVDRKIGKLVHGFEGIEVWEGGIGFAGPVADLVPSVAVWDGLVGGDGAEPGFPFGIGKAGGAGHRGAANERLGESLSV